MPENRESFELTEYSEPVQSIITDVPHWLVRWGISLFFLILIAFLALSSIISMPDTVKGTVIIESEVPPEEIIVGKAGKLMALFVKENLVVDSGEILGFLHSTAYHRDVLKLSNIVDSVLQQLNIDSFDNFWLREIRSARHLGELHASYQEFIQNYIGFNAFLSNGFNSQRRNSMIREMENIQKQNRQLQEQLKLQEEDYQLSETNFEAYERLFQRKVISPREYRTEQSKLLNSKLPMQNTRSTIISNNSNYEQRQSELLELENQIAERRASFVAVINRFKSEIDAWKSDHILQANSKGKVVFSNRMKVGQWIDANKPVFYIEPENYLNEGFIGMLNFGQFSIGKVKEGQKVVIRLEAYPYQEFGILYGIIDYLPDISYSDSLYSARVKLINDGISSYNRKLQLKNGLVAQAEVITDKRTLLSKLFDNVYSLLNNRPN